MLSLNSSAKQTAVKIDNMSDRLLKIRTNPRLLKNLRIVDKVIWKNNKEQKHSYHANRGNKQSQGNHSGE